MIPERNGQTDGETDGRTDRFAISISRVSMLTRDKNNARNDRQRPSRTLRDDGATDAQQVQ